MYCPNCGTKLNDTAAFCPVCGTQIKQKPSEEPHLTPPQKPRQKLPQESHQKFPQKLFIPGIITAGILCLAGTAVFISSRSPKPSSAEEVFENMQSAEAADCTIDIALNFDADLNSSDDSDTSFNLLLSGKGTGSLTADPVAIGLDGALDISALDQSTTMTYKYYAAPDEYGDVEAYTYSGLDGDGSWSSEYLGDSDSLKEDLAAIDLSKLSEIGVDFTLENKPVKHNGKKCYVLSTEISTESLTVLTDTASEYSSAFYDFSYAMDSQDGTVLDLECYVDAKTWHLTGFHADLTGSDFNSLLSSLFGSVIDVNVKDASLDVDCTYGEVNTITVPQEALDY